MPEYDVEYLEEFREVMNDFAGAASDEVHRRLWRRLKTIQAPIERALAQGGDTGELRRQRNELVDALDRFFYDLHYTAPEAASHRITELGARITPIILEFADLPKRPGIDRLTFHESEATNPEGAAE